MEGRSEQLFFLDAHQIIIRIRVIADQTLSGVESYQSLRSSLFFGSDIIRSRVIADG